MRHRKAARRLSRTTSHRQAMMRNLVTSFLDGERVVTTDAKAKELRPLAEKMITLGKRGDLHARRQALAVIRRREVVEKLFSDLKDRYQDRSGGYLRITKLGTRRGDAASMSVVELLPAGATKAPRKKSAKPKAKAKPKAAKAKAAAPAEAEAAPAEVEAAEAPAEDKKPKPAAKKAPAKKKAETEAAPKKKPAAKKAPAKKKAETEAASEKKPATKKTTAKKKTESEAAPKKKPAAKKKTGEE
jgi:large subunit ribosomal protein L17